MSLYPLTFEPRFKDRVWGGRRLAELYGKELPAGTPIGESWEISDRPGDASVISNGPLAGKDLRWLMEQHQAELLGSAPAQQGTFPLLIKILDARDKLSLQVHPPADKAAALKGDPKTEMWYIADADPGAMLYVGLRRGVTRADFERALAEGTVESCFHRIPVKAGDTMFLPSGRVHAIGSGLVIFEIQQNSDTTYRVYDWNRVGLDGKPRALHIRESLESIDFADFEPELVPDQWAPSVPQVRPLVRHELFDVDACRLQPGLHTCLPGGSMRILGVVSGQLLVGQGDARINLKPGRFCVLPASLGEVEIASPEGATWLDAVAGSGV
jgi:mannose-6-phosphate isomerase